MPDVLLTSASNQRSEDMAAVHWRDEWPCMANGDSYDGKQLLQLAHSGKSPFHGVWDVAQLVCEVEERLNTTVTDIPSVTKGSNNYGFHMKCSNMPDILVRLARSDVNMPGFEGFPIEVQAPEARFEAAIYHLLRQEPDIRASHLLYSRVPMKHPRPNTAAPQDIAGRRLFVFETSKGVSDMWKSLNDANKLLLLDQLACVRAALFSYKVPLDFATEYFHDRLFKFKPDSLSRPVTPTRDFWIHVLEEKVRATIRSPGDMIGWEDDQETVGTVALAAKQCLLRAIPFFLPQDTPHGSFYRFVLEHGDFGIHNTTIMEQNNGQPLVTSLYDWETACLWPAIASDPLVAVFPVDLTTDETGAPSLARLPHDATQADIKTYQSWADHYIKVLYREAPDYEAAIEAGKDFRKLWYALRDWRGGNSEEFFGALGAWADRRVKEIESLRV